MGISLLSPDSFSLLYSSLQIVGIPGPDMECTKPPKEVYNLGTFSFSRIIYNFPGFLIKSHNSMTCRGLDRTSFFHSTGFSEAVATAQDTTTPGLRMLPLHRSHNISTTRSRLGHFFILRHWYPILLLLIEKYFSFDSFTKSASLLPIPQNTNFYFCHWPSVLATYTFTRNKRIKITEKFDNYIAKWMYLKLHNVY